MNSKWVSLSMLVFNLVVAGWQWHRSNIEWAMLAAFCAGAMLVTFVVKQTVEVHATVADDPRCVCGCLRSNHRFGEGRCQQHLFTSGQMACPCEKYTAVAR